MDGIGGRFPLGGMPFGDVPAAGAWGGTRGGTRRFRLGCAFRGDGLALDVVDEKESGTEGFLPAVVAWKVPWQEGGGHLHER